MSKQKKNSSCLGLFFKSFLLTSLILANLCALGLMAGIKFFGLDYATWTDFSSLQSHPLMMIYGVLAVGLVVGFAVAFLSALVSFFFGGESKKSGTAGRSTPKPRPQSNRRTTV